MPGVWVTAPESDSLTVVFQDRSLSQVCLTLTGGNCIFDVYVGHETGGRVLLLAACLAQAISPSIPRSISAVDCLMPAGNSDGKALTHTHALWTYRASFPR